MPEKKRGRSFRSVCYTALLVASVLNLLGAGLLFYLCADGLESMGTFIISAFLGMTTILIGIIWAMVLVSRRKFTSRPFTIVFAVAWIGLVCAVVTTYFTYWPMRLVFPFQHRHLDHLANQVAHGQRAETPAHLGFYTVTLADRNLDGVVGLWTCPRADHCRGFVKCRAADAQRNFGDVWVDAELPGGWLYIEDND